MSLFKIAVEAEISRKELSKQKQEIEKKQLETEDFSELERLEKTIIFINRAINNLNQQIEYIGIKYRNEQIPEEYIILAKLTENQEKVLQLRFIEGKNFAAIENQLEIKNAREVFRKAIIKIKQAMTLLIEAHQNGLTENEAKQFVLMTQREREVYTQSLKGLSNKEIAEILDIDKGDVSRLLKKARYRLESN
ncbi:MAG: sigma factor-like helix-turn-helix DNA-binding protein [Tepidibacillus sp.]